MAKRGRIIVTGKRRDNPDVDRLARAIVQYVTMQMTSASKSQPTQKRKEKAS